MVNALKVLIKACAIVSREIDCIVSAEQSHIAVRSGNSVEFIKSSMRVFCRGEMTIIDESQCLSVSDAVSAVMVNRGVFDAKISKIFTDL